MSWNMPPIYLLACLRGWVESLFSKPSISPEKLASHSEWRTDMNVVCFVSNGVTHYLAGKEMTVEGGLSMATLEFVPYFMITDELQPMDFESYEAAENMITALNIELVKLPEIYKQINSGLFVGIVQDLEDVRSNPYRLYKVGVL